VTYGEDAGVGQAFSILLFMSDRDQYLGLLSSETIYVTLCVF